MIVVTGATGNVGQPLVRALAEAGEEVRAVSRTPAPDLPDGVRHVRADLADPESMREALAGADALFLLLAGELMGGAGDPARLMELAKAGGVRRVVMLSSQILGTRPGSPTHGGLHMYEEAVRQSGTDWTVLRAGGFASNAFAWAESVRTGRTVAAPFADVALPLVDPADIAEVAAQVLRAPGHAGSTYVLTGPAAVSPREQTAAIGAALGEPVELVELSRAQAREHLARFVPEPALDGTLAIIGEPLPGEQVPSPDVARVLGRPARTFGQWAERNAAAFR